MIFEIGDVFYVFIGIEYVVYLVGEVRVFVIECEGSV